MLNPRASPIAVEGIAEPSHTLSFPGKVLACDEALFIADSNHHQIVEAGPDGPIRRRFGSGQPALLDGPAGVAAFAQPQGMAVIDGRLYVADTENHAVREVNLGSGAVRTIAGTGVQAVRAGLGGPGRSTPLSSPWDLAADGRTLYIAMAGTHQIWSLDLDHETVTPFAGTGREGLRDGPLRETWFAQSSGLALADGHLLRAAAEVADHQFQIWMAVVQHRLEVAEKVHPLGEGIANEGDALILDELQRQRARWSARTSLCLATRTGRGTSSVFSTRWGSRRGTGFFTWQTATTTRSNGWTRGSAP